MNNELNIKREKKQWALYGVMHRFFYRISNASKLFVWALMNPDTLNKSSFKMLSDLMTMILKVATENRHYMTHIAYVHPDEGEKQIVSIWAGAGVGAEPQKRIAELIAENNILKAQIARNVSSNGA